MTIIVDDRVAELKRANAELQRKLDERTAALNEALDQQTATAEVLQVINSSPGDLAPVFNAMLEKATRLCEAAYGQLATFDGEFFRFVAVHGENSFAEQQPSDPLPPSYGVTWTRIVGGEHVVHMADVMETGAYRDGHIPARGFVEIGGGRSLLTVALRKDTVLLGALTVYRQEVRAFNDKQIALLQNFAAQAVIAMENARLLTGARKALEQQTATTEVLQVINSSPGDLAPVFDAMLEKATRLCEASFGVLCTYDGTSFQAAALRGAPAAYAEFLTAGPLRPGPGNGLTRVAAGEKVVHVVDLAAEDVYRSGEALRRALVDLGGARSALTVGLLKDELLLGAFIIYRREVRAFTEKQIALLQNFATQAVIAMENARLITETREALEQQTATAEVLQVINRSPGDLTPVFDAMLEKAMTLCGASFGGLSTYDGELFRAVATRGVPPALADFFRDPYTVGPQSYFGQLVRGEGMLHVPDLAAEISAGEADPLTRPGTLRGRAFVELGNARTGLFLALRQENVLRGILWFYRQEVRPFSEKQIALLHNFAAQAVIAMENARLITETREALDQQTATAEVLQVINSSPGDLAPVFDVVLEKATSVCDAAFGTLWTYDGERFQAVALRQVPEGYAEFLSRAPLRPVPFSGLGRVAAGESVAHFVDVAANEAYRGADPGLHALLDLGKARSTVAVPLRKDDAILGAITAYRQEVRPFSDKQIALLQNFAAQAVIAMENARLITETREALDQQTATAEVLQVINSSPGDLAPVFDAMLERAMRLCEAAFGLLTKFDGERFHALALRGPSAFME